MKPLIVSTITLLTIIVGNGLINGFTPITAAGSLFAAIGLGVALRRGAWQQ